MKLFIKSILIFTTPFAIYIIFAILILPQLQSIKFGPSTEDQINSQFKVANSRDYDLLILGNSRTYRGLNPNAFYFSSYNFSHDNDSFNQMYYKLKYLLDKGISIKYLIIGVDYFQFSFKAESRNYAYGAWLGKEYMNDFKKSYYSYKLTKIKSSIHPTKLLSLRQNRNEAVLKDNGQYIVPSVANKSDSIERNIQRLDFQEKYFKKIINICKSEQIKLFMVMLPVRENELKSYDQDDINSFNAFIENYEDKSEIFYLNYSELEDFSYVNYTDITHLNEQAANRFSYKLNLHILELLNF